MRYRPDIFRIKAPTWLHILLLTALLCCSLHTPLHTQVVYETKYHHEADAVLFKALYPSQADIRVYMTEYRNQADPEKGTWYMTRYPEQADWKIYWTPYRQEADCTVYITPYASQAKRNDCYFRFKEKKNGKRRDQ